MGTVQYRLMAGKLTTQVDGPDDADVVISVDRADAALDPAVAFMSGRLKASGHTGVLLELFRSGAAAEAIARLARS